MAEACYWMAFVSFGTAAFGSGGKFFRKHTAGTCARSLSAQCCASLPSFVTKIKPAVDASLSARDLGIENVEWRDRVLTVSISSLADIRGEPNSEAASSEDCAFASRVIGEFLDDADIDGEYTMEVTTPGTKDELTKDREFAAFKGFPVRVELQPGESKAGKSEVVGTLQGRSPTSVDVNVKGRKVSVPRESVSTVKLISEG